MSIKNISIEALEHAIAGCFSFKVVAEKLGLCNNGGTLTRLKKKAKENNIDFSHFTGPLWSKGKTSLDDKRLRKESTELIFTENSNASPSYIRTLILKKNLIPYCCQQCSNGGEWNNQKLNLQLDHINGVRTDHRLKNLRWLCPNCHSQTDTYTSKNKNHSGKKKISDEDLLKAVKNNANIYQALKQVGLQNGRNYSRVRKLLKNTGE